MTTVIGTPMVAGPRPRRRLCMLHVMMMVGAAALSMLPAAGLAQTASSPAPVDLIATLNSVCVAAQGDRQRAATLAVEAGYSPIPAETVPRIRNTSEEAGFIRSNGTDISFIMTGKMSRGVRGETVVMEVCGVTVRPTDHRALDARVREVMGFAPVRGLGMEAYAWLQTPEGRAPSRTLTDPQVLSMAATGQMRVVALDRAGPGSTLMYLLPRLD